MAKAYSYLRISSEKQTRGGGIQRQMEASARYAEQHGYELVDTLQDVGVSAFHGKNAKEGALGGFLTAIDEGHVEQGSLLIVESLDRLSRQDPMSAFTQFSQIISKGITIVTLVDNQVYSPETVKDDVSKLFLSLGSMMRAHDESKTKSVRQVAAWKRKRNAGELMTARAPAWLEVIDGEFHVKQGAAETIQTIFDLCINGMGTYSVTKHMNSDLERFPTFSGGKGWNTAYVGKILTSRHVLGELQPFSSVTGERSEVGDVISDYYPQIISEEKFLLAQAAMAGRRNKGAGRKGEAHTNLFSRIVRCGKCGSAMVYRARGSSGKGVDMLRCQSSYLNSGCNCPGWQYPEFEEAFYRFVKEVNFVEVFAGEDAGKQTAALHQRRTVVQEKIAEVEKSIETIVDRMVSADLSETMIAALSKREQSAQVELQALKAELPEIDNAIAELTAENVASAQNDFIEKYESLSDAGELREVRFHLSSIIKRSVEKIECFNGFRVFPWEVENISDRFRRMVEERGMDTDEKIAEYLNKQTGRVMHDKCERYFVVTFRNGVRRYVRPGVDGSIVIQSERMVGFRNN